MPLVVWPLSAIITSFFACDRPIIDVVSSYILTTCPLSPVTVHVVNDADDPQLPGDSESTHVMTVSCESLYCLRTEDLWLSCYVGC